MNLNYTQEEMRLRELILNACQQRNRSGLAASQQNQSWENHLSAAPLTLVDKMTLSHGEFTGTMRFFFNGEEIIALSYNGWTDKAWLRDLARFLDRGTIKFPFRGNTKLFTSMTDNTVKTSYEICGHNIGEKSFFEPSGQTIDIEDRLTIKDGRTDRFVVHQARFVGGVRVSPQRLKEVIRYLQ